MRMLPETMPKGFKQLGQVRLGHLGTRRGVLDEEMAWSTFSYYAVLYFAALKELEGAIQQMKDRAQKLRRKV